MKPVAIEKASDHLEAARQSANALKLDDGFKSFERAWSDFVSQANRVYAKLEQGAKGCRKSEPWFGRCKSDRKKDALLSYLHHARNSDEHGLDYITQRAADAMTLGFPATTEATVGFEMMLDENGRVHIRNPTVKSPKGGINSVEIQNPRVELAPVTDRGKTYAPPTMHVDRPIVDKSPSGIATLAIRYLENMLDEACKLPKH